MRHFFSSILLTAALSGSALLAQAQTGRSLTGVVQTDAGEALPGATVFVKGSYQGTTCNSEGQFTFPISTQIELPLVLSVSFVGFETQLDTVRTFDQTLRIVLAPSVTAINEVVVSASRVEERALQAPATVDKLNTEQLARLTSPDLLTNLGRLKGVDANTTSFFASNLSTRGFGGFTSERLLQLVDNMDTQAPSLNNNAGNSLGLPEVDIASVEVLHGPSSALYGANAFNGVVLTNSKDPFRYEGLSVRLRGGNRDYVDGQLRYAQRVGRRFAFKLVGSFARAQDWIAENEAALPNSYSPGNNPAGSNLGYNAINRYGDDVSNLYSAAPLSPGGPPNLLAGKRVFMPGWSEREILGPDDHAQLYRIAPSVHYLITDKIKAMVEYKRAVFETNFAGSDRYHLKNNSTTQIRAELRSDNWYVRAFQTEDFGKNPYDMVFTGFYMQNSVDPKSLGNSGTANRTYAQQYFASYAGVYNTELRQNGGNVAAAELAARTASAKFQLVAGSEDYNKLREKLIADRTPGSGAGLSSNSFMNDYSGQYTFKPAFAEITVGGAYRLYRLGSNGLLFADYDGVPLRNQEYGSYAQIVKTVFDNRLKLTGAVRVDGFQNFKAQVSPRASLVFSPDAAQNHNFRLSYNQAYRSPTQQGQYLGLDLTRILLLGNIGNGFQGYSLASVAGPNLGTILTSPNPAAELAKYAINVAPLRPERVATVEIGYKGLIAENLVLDVNYYVSRYRDFIGQARFIGNKNSTLPSYADFRKELFTTTNPFSGRDRDVRVIQAQTNLDQEVNTQGGLLSLTYSPSTYLNVNANYALNVLDRSNLPDGFQAYYNSPKHKYNVGAYGKALKVLTYSANYHWSEGFYYESPFAAGDLPSFSSVDAQLGYALPKLATTVQLGASNLTNSVNAQEFGGAQIGRLLWAGLAVDVR